MSEIVMLDSMHDVKSAEIAMMMNRTYYSISQMRQRIREAHRRKELGMFIIRFKKEVA